MSYAGRNYVLMQDFQFATTKGRTVLVVEYRGRWKEDKEYSSLNNVQTDDIKVVCKITHAR
jgi:hypothetical protein